METGSIITTGSTKFQDLNGIDIGMSIAGIAEYLEDLKANVLEKAKSTLTGESLEKVVAAINNNWQGASRDKFLTNLEQAIKHISTDLDAEYDDLLARLEEIQNNYLKQDNQLMY